MTWDDLPYWQSGEWQVVQERLEDLDAAKILYNPSREVLFRALDLCPLDTVRVVILGQDPYPDSKYATGVAFSVGARTKTMPPSLVNILAEYARDLHYDVPKSGNLEKWCKQGVLLWNAIPSCLYGKSRSHDWPEWELLTEQILQETSKKSAVFALMGNFAHKYEKYIDQDASEVIRTSHPSPLGHLSGTNPFSGSRIFTTINTKLVVQGLEPIDWRL